MDLSRINAGVSSLFFIGHGNSNSVLSGLLSTTSFNKLLYRLLLGCLLLAIPMGALGQNSQYIKHRGGAEIGNKAINIEILQSDEPSPYYLSVGTSSSSWFRVSGFSETDESNLMTVDNPPPIGLHLDKHRYHDFWVELDVSTLGSKTVKLNINGTVPNVFHGASVNVSETITINYKVVAPEIGLEGLNNNAINSGDNSPTIADGTVFEDAAISYGNDRLFKINNTGDGPLIISKFELVGDDAFEFKVTVPGFSSADYDRVDSNSGTPISTMIPKSRIRVLPNNAFPFEVNFAPTSIGNKRTQVKVYSNDRDESVYTFDIAAKATGQLEVSGATIVSTGDNEFEFDLGSQLVGNTKTLSFEVKNIGFDPLELEPEHFTTSGSAFSVKNVGSNGIHGSGYTPLPFTLAGGVTETIYVTFNAASIGEVISNLVIDNPSIDRTDIRLKGEGLGAQPSFYEWPTLRDDIQPFLIDTNGKVPLGTSSFPRIQNNTSITKYYIIKNFGNFTFTINSNVVSGSADFRIQGLEYSSGGFSFPKSLDAGMALGFSITFNPTTAGTKSAKIQVSNNINTYEFTVTGESVDNEIAVTGGPNNTEIQNGDHTASVSDGTDFGNQNVYFSKSENFTIKNNGTSNLLIKDILIEDIDANDFTLERSEIPKNTIIPGGSSKEFTVIFAPKSEEGDSDLTRRAQVTILNDDLDEEEFSFSIKGVGIPFTTFDVETSGNTLSEGELRFDETDNRFFGRVLSGSGQTNKTFTIKQDGVHPAYIDKIEIIGDSKDDFSLVGNVSGVRVDESGYAFTVNFHPFLEGFSRARIIIYSQRLPGGSMGFDIGGIGYDFPRLSSSSPSDDMTQVPTNSDIVINFSEDIQLIEIVDPENPDNHVNGVYIRIVNTSNGSVFYNFAEAVSLLSVSGRTMTMRLPEGASFEEATNYAVQIGSEVVVDEFGNFFKGISNNTELNFRTISSDIYVTGNGQSIENADYVPSTSDNTLFPTTSVYASTKKDYTVYNQGVGDLVIRQAVFTSTHASDFVFEGFSLPATIPAGESRNFSISFRPTGEGVRSANFNFVNNDPDESAYHFVVRGEAKIQPEINVTSNGQTIENNDYYPSTTDNTLFSETLIYTTSKKTFRVENQGSANLVISQAVFTGAHASDFVFEGLTLPATIPAGESRDFSISFSPTGEGQRYANFSFVNNDADEAAYLFTIQGDGIAPEIYVTGNGQSIENADYVPSTSDNTLFPTTSVYASTKKEYTVYNQGVGDLVIRQAVFTSTHASDFVFEGFSLPATIPAGESRNFSISFRPTGEGVRSANFNFVNNDPDESAYHFVVRGEAKIQPEINVTSNGQTIENNDYYPSTTDNTLFSETLIYTTSKKTFRVENQGSANLVISQAVFTGAHASDFVFEGLTLPATIPAGESRDFSISFSPTGEGQRYANFSFVNNDADEAAYLFTIQGDGIAPEIYVTGNGQSIENADYVPSTSDNTLFPTTSVYASTKKDYTVYNQGVGDLVIRQAVFTSTHASDFVFEGFSLPATIPAGESRDFSISFRPTGEGQRYANFNFVNNDPDESAYHFVVRGEAVNITLPVLNTQDIAIQLDQDGNADITIDQVVNGYSDISESVTLSLDRTSFHCADLAGDQEPGLAYSSSSNVGIDTFQGALGMGFDLSAPLTIDALGAFDHDSDGIAGTIHVGIFDRNTQTVVAGLQTSISGASDPLINNHRLRSITPVVLQPGNYMIVAKGFNGTDLNGNFDASANLTDDASGTIQFVGDSFYGVNYDSNVFDYPNNEDGGPANRYKAGTFGYTIPGRNKVTLTASDPYGNFGESTVFVIVEDKIAPVIAQADPIEVGSEALFTPASLSASDNCGTVQAQVIGNNVNTSVPGTYQVVYQATDASGNQSAPKTQSVKVIDDIAPTVVTQDITVQLDEYGNASIAPEQVNNGTSDNSNGVLTYNLDQTSFDCSDLAGDQESGLAYSSSSNVGIQAFEGAMGMAFDLSAPLTIDALGAFDHNSDGIAGTIDVGIFDRNTQTVVAGLQTSISGASDPLVNNHRLRSITPVVLQPGNYMIVAKGFYGADMNGNFDASANFTDDASGIIQFVGSSFYDLNYDSNVFDYPSKADGGPANRYKAGTFGYTIAGRNTVTLTATDLAGNSSSGTAFVIVEDKIAPVIAQADPIEVGSETLFTPASISASDNCGTGQAQVIGNNVNTSVPGTYQVVYQATDASGNISAPMTQSVIVIDEVAPTVVTQDITVQLDEYGNASITPEQVNNGSTDNSGSVTLSLDQTSFDCADLAGSQESGLAYSSSSNAGIQAFEGAMGMGFDLSAPLTIDALGAFDHNSDGIAGTIHVGIFDRNTQTVVAGLQTSISGASDPLVNNHRLRSITPVVLQPGNYMIVAKGFYGADMNGNFDASANFTDDASGIIQFVGSSFYDLNYDSNVFDYPSKADGGPANRYKAGTFGYTIAGRNTVTLTATDLAGNSSSGTAFVIVEDKIAPVIAQANPIEVGSEASFTPASLSASDNCGTVQAQVISNNVNTSVPGTYQVVYQATDASGNQSASMTQIVTVIDDLAPTVMTQNITVQLDENGNASITPEQVNNGSTDNSNGELSYNLDQTTFDCDDLAPTCTSSSLKINGHNDQVILPEKIALGNSFTLEYWVKNNGADGVYDRITTTSPLFTFETAKNSAGQLSIYGLGRGWIQTGVSISSTGYDHIAWVFDGSTVRLYKNGIEAWSDTGFTPDTRLADWSIGNFIDAANFSIDEARLWNTARTVQQINDNASTCGAIDTQGLIFRFSFDEGVGTTATESVSGTDIEIVGGTPVWENGDVQSIGYVPVTLSVTDEAGNTSSAAARVTVEDKIAPVIPQAAAIEVDIRTSFSPAAITATDNCGTITAEVISNNVNTLILGTYQVQYQAKDASDNLSEVMTQTVKVVDNVAPVITSAVAIDFTENSTGVAYTILATDDSNMSYSLGSSFDEAYFSLNGAELSFITPPDYETKTTYVVKVMVTDAAGNMASRDVTINILDVDDIAPAGYSITIDQDPINLANSNAIDFTFAGAEVGARYNYSFTSSEGLGTVLGSGTITTATDQIAGVDLSSLADGVITLTVTLTDANNNTGVEVTDLSTKDTAAPSGYGVNFDEPSVNEANAMSVGFTFSNAEVGAAYAYTLTSNAGGTPVSGSGTIGAATENVSGLDLRGLSDGTVSLSVMLTDENGNQGVAVDKLVSKDVLLPGVQISSNTSPTVFATSFPLSIEFEEVVNDFEIGDLTLDNGTASNLSGSGASYTVDIAPVVDGAVKVSIAEGVATDAAGNPNTASGIVERTVEATNEAPTAIGLSAITVLENTAAGFELATLSVTDSDFGDVHFFSLVAGPGDDDNGSFEIIGNVLKTKAAFDYENNNSLSVRIKATDLSNASFTTTKTISVTNVDEPAISVSIPDPDNAGQTVSQMIFEDTGSGQTSTSVFNVANTGTDGDLAITDITLPAGFTVDQSQFTIAAGESQELIVTFSPTAAIVYAGAVNITSNVGVNGFNVAGGGLVNSAPVATPPSARVNYTLRNVIELTGYDPDGDAIDFEVVTQPSLGTLVATANEGRFIFQPTVSSPDQIYEDEIVFRVVEEGDGLSSANATYQFSFENEDQAHTISAFNVNNVDGDNKSFGMGIEDEVFNDDYTVVLEYLDRTDELNPVTRYLTNANFQQSAFNVAGNKLSLSASANRIDHPYLFAEGQVLMTLTVSTNNGYSSQEVYVLENDGANVSSIQTDIIRSDDGNFFLVPFSRTMPENASVGLNLIAVEFGAFDLLSSSIQISRQPVNGNITEPVETSRRANIVIWNLEYSSDSEIGLLDSLEFSVYHPERDETLSATGFIEIIEVPDAPSIEDLTDQEMEEDATLTVAVNAFDPDSELNITAASSDADNVSVSFANGQLTVSPVEDYSGQVIISVLAIETDSASPQTAFDQFVVNVLPVNDQPVVDAIADRTIDEDNATTISLSATDIDAELPVFGFTASVDNEANASIEITGSQLIIIPTADFFGDIQVSVTADDRLGTNNSLSAPETFTVTVNPVNDAPEINANIPIQSLIEGFPAYSLNLSSYFEDKETTSSALIYTMSDISLVTSSVEGSVLTISPVAGVYGVETATVTASDGEQSVSQIVTFVSTRSSLEVVVTNSITDLQLNEDFGTATIDLSNVFSYSANSNASFTYTLSGNSTVGTSIDGTILTLTSIDNLSGTDQLFIVGRVDGKAAFTSFEVAVTPVNDAPVLVSPISDESIREDDVYTRVIPENLINDVDGDQLTYNADFPVTWLSFDANTRTLNGTPQNADVGEVSVTMTATDPHGASVSDTFIITVQNTNDDPTDITLSSSAIAENLEVGTLIGSFSTTDPDVTDNEFTYSLVSGDGAIDNGSFSMVDGALYTAEKFNFEAKSTYSIRVRTRDAFEGSFEKTLTVTITDVEEGPPVFDSEPVTSVDETSLYRYPIQVTIASGLDLTLSLAEENDWLTLVEEEGYAAVLVGDPAGRLESTAVEIVATDSNGGVTVQSFSININDVTAPVVIGRDLTFYMAPGDEITLTAEDLLVSATDNDKVESVSISKALFTVADRGNNEVEITATDASGNQGTATVNVEIINIAADDDDDGIPELIDKYPNDATNGGKPAVVTYVWDDLDGDGRQDANEPGIADVLVKLRRSNGNVLQQGRTNPYLGMVAFFDLNANDYVKLSFDKPNSGYAFTDKNRGNGRQNSDADRNKGHTRSFKLTGTNVVKDYDAGMWSPGQVEAFVWDDLDGDGRQDAGEPGIRNVLVKLRKSNGNVITQAYTNAEGIVALENAPADQSIKLSFDKPSSSYAFTHKYRGNNRQNSDADRNNGHTRTFKLTRGNQTYTNADAGLWSPGQVEAFVWDDLDGDGRQDANEPGIANVSVKLRRSNGNVISRGQTDENGMIMLDRAPADQSIKLSFDKPNSSYAFTHKDRGHGRQDSDADRNNGHTRTFKLTRGNQTYTNADAGMWSPGQVEAFVWDDLDGDGRQDANEPGVENVLVKLRRSNGNVISQARTNAEGIVIVDNAPADQSIKLSFDKPNSGYAFTHKNRGNYKQNSDADRKNGQTGTFKLSRGNQTYTTADAGMWSPGTVETYVWNDTDKDGRQDSNEQGLANVLVKLRRSNGNVIVQARTDANGLVELNNAPADQNLFVTVDRAGADWTFSPRFRGRKDANSDVDGKGRSYKFKLNKGNQTLTTVDAGQFEKTDKPWWRWWSDPADEQLDKEDIGLETLPQIELEVSPNPAASVARIQFMSELGGRARLGIVNQNGTQVATLFDGEVDAGKQNTVTYDVSELANGVYIIRLVTAGEARNVKLMVKR